AQNVEWVVHSKSHSCNPEKALEYLAHYTHKVAISNHRLLNVDNDEVTFSYKDYRDGDKSKKMTLPASEFIRRFLLHVLPDGFMRIRYYGLLCNQHREHKLTLCGQLLGAGLPPPIIQQSSEDFTTRYQQLTGDEVTDARSASRAHCVAFRSYCPWSALPSPLYPRPLLLLRIPHE
ncbi:MAG: IS91 family transposase, partial [Blastocatellia bacterium]